MLTNLPDEDLMLPKNMTKSEAVNESLDILIDLRPFKQRLFPIKMVCQSIVRCLKVTLKYPEF